MCGIIALVDRCDTHEPRSRAAVDALIDAAAAAQPDTEAVAAAVQELDRMLKGPAGVELLIDAPELSATVLDLVADLGAFADERERVLDDATLDEETAAHQSAAVIDLRDALWSIRNDRLRAADSVAELLAGVRGVAAIRGYLFVHQALAALDRLEVRGRDSAGLHVFVWGVEPDPLQLDQLAERGADPLFTTGAARCVADTISFVYKTAKEIGRLGDNTDRLREAIRDDELLRQLLCDPAARVAVLGHTRWASVGTVSEPNAHPVNSDELSSPTDGAPYVVAALNGDVDNHAALRVEAGCEYHDQIGTDAKIIPTLVAARMRNAHQGFFDAFRSVVARFDGSVAIAAASADAPNTLALAQRGSGQGLYVGLADDRYIVASEPYGLIEETDRYYRLDGEHGGEVVILDGSSPGAVSSIRRFDYGGGERPITAEEITTAEMTTRDIDRRGARHFFIKELLESPESVQRTIRRRIVREDDRFRAHIGAEALPTSIRDRLASGAISKIRVIGQGTAAIAGRAIAALLDELTDGEFDVDAMPATELSGFYLRPDMTNTLAIAVSQSGTTNDTNVTVGLLRQRGASVIAVVNRRESDLCSLADGVFFTSDGRDLEMSVASTKAFYSQAAAGALLACEISETAGTGDDGRRSRLLASLLELPNAMRTVIEARPQIAEAADRFAPTKKYWTVVGNGPNKVAGEELRIKLSELCYKSISFDVTEDKKHIDLSSEPLVIVCAVGLTGGTAADVAKEVATFHAHKSTPIVIIDEHQLHEVGLDRYPAAAVIKVPTVDPALGFVLAAMAGHLFGYEAAVAIDLSAQPLRRAREALDAALAGRDGDVVERLQTTLLPISDEFLEALRLGRYEGQLEPSTVLRLTGRLRDLASERPLDLYQRFTGKIPTPSNLVDDLAESLNIAIDELTRPVDAIKHQAKTVTVGISRSDEKILDRALVRTVLDIGVGRDVLGYHSLKVLAALDPAVEEVTGYTRYRIADGLISVIDRGGVARTLRSRVGDGVAITGTKRQVARNRAILVARGRNDGRKLVFVPEQKGGEAVGITLLHVDFVDRLPAAQVREVLEVYDRRYDRLVDWVLETEPTFDEERLAKTSVERLLIDPISDVADDWRT